MTRRLVPVAIMFGTLVAWPGCSDKQPDKSKMPDTAAASHDQWTIWIADGKNDTVSVNLLPARSPLENYGKNLGIIHPWQFKEQPSAKSIRLQPVVTKIGRWADYEVYDITDKLNNTKQIMLKDTSGCFRVLYSQIPGCTASVDDLPRIVKTDSTDILAYRTRVPGTGCFYIEHYFLQDPQSHLPVPLDDRAITDTLREILPKGYGVWKGGGFNIETLEFKHAVWKRGDGNCGPTGGSAKIRFKIRGTALMTIEKHYDPTPVWPG